MSVFPEPVVNLDTASNENADGCPEKSVKKTFIFLNFHTILTLNRRFGIDFGNFKEYTVTKAKYKVSFLKLYI